ncbi:Endonuclease/exonuclease/phosphatase [Suillus occidentalis]|nr:Endonuclease/exonuclease/phosphatase [Suillus occidentalis]
MGNYKQDSQREQNWSAIRLLVLNSQDPARPGNSAGIAFVLNKEMVNTTDAKMVVLIPGRAAALSLKWHNEKTITILNIYAPNNHNSHTMFWDTIRQQWTNNNLGELDFMLGDFNITEDPLDRAPARFDNEQAVSALRNFRTSLNLQDTWRHTHPNTRLFTFNSNTNSLSRLDRIYTSTSHIESVSDWKAHQCQIPTDHNLVSARYAPPGLPHIGKGRWSWPIGILTDTKLLKKIESLGIELQNEIENNHLEENRTIDNNPQTSWEQFKKKRPKRPNTLLKYT